MSLDVFAITTGDGEGGNEHAREAHLCLLSRAEHDVRLHQAALSFQVIGK
jgi:hypothetical protein